MRGGLTALVVLFHCGSLVAACGQRLTGTVVDPQHGAVVGAKVTLNCDQRADILHTDSLGRFGFDVRPGIEDCKLHVNHPGFETFSQVVGLLSPPLLIQLKVGKINEIVNVSVEDRDEVSSYRSALALVSLSDAELKKISNNTQDLIRYAKALAGTTQSRDSIYVDGLPTSVLPPAETIARITVNADPYSAEYSDSYTNGIEITTKSAERRWRFNFGGASVGVGGGNVLAPELRSDSRSANFSLTGPIPKLPLTFSISTNLGYDKRDQPIMAFVPGPQTTGLASGLSTALATNRYETSNFDSHYAKSDAARLNFAFYQSSSRSSNSNVGGIILPEAGVGGALGSREARITYELQGPLRIFRGGAVLNQSESRVSANSYGLGITVLGTFTRGGAPTNDERSRHLSLTLKNVADWNLRDRLWSAGLIVSHSADSEIDIPNPSGVMVFSSLQAYAKAITGDGAGTWFVSQGDGRVGYTSTDAAFFAQGDLLRSRDAILRGGLRADYETRRGLFLSPRIFAARQLHGFVLRGGGGLFVHNSPNQTFLQLLKNDGSHLRTFVVKNVSLSDLESEINTSSILTVSSRQPTEFSRERDFLFKSSVERRFGTVASGLEYTWARGFHLPGSRRVRTESGWIDLLDSNRRSSRHALHARVSYEWKGQSIVGHYEFIHARDNTDGPFSFPQDQADVGSEWAQATGVSPRNLELVGSFRLPASVSLSVVASSRSSAPYNIISGADWAGDGLYNDRDGRPRNSGNGPAYNSVALFGYRRIPLPRFLRTSKERLFLDVGLQVDNLLNRKNYLGLGSVIASPLFGKPLGGLPGRSVRLWFSID